jgi:Spy/CpxP family protein refolding chaperone
MKSQAQGPVRRLRVLAAAGCVAIVGAAACAAKVDQQAPRDELTAKELTRHGARHFRGPVSVVIEAAHEHGKLSADQAQALATIARELEADRAGRRQLREQLRSSAVAVVRAGGAGSAHFERSVGEAVLAVEERVRRNTDALEEIHATLRPEQRAAVAAALRARIVKKLGEGGAREGEQRRRDGFRRFASHLMLSKLQLAQLETIKHELLGEKQQLHPSREELFSLVDAFEGDGFGSALDTLRGKKTAILRSRIANAGQRTDTVLSIFTPEQRELLADLILQGPRKVLLGDEFDQAARP